MASSVFPVPVTSSGPNSYSSTIATANLQYKAVQSLSAGIYTITTSSTGSQATITFYNSTGASFATATTASGTLTYNLASAATGYYIQTDTGSNIIVSIALTGNSVTGTQISGTLDTITASGTYNQTGLLYVLACAGGGGGAGTGSGSRDGGAGGSIASGFVVANTATTVTIGTAGNGGNANTLGNAGGQTSFGNLVVAPFAGGASAGGTNNTGNANGGLGIVVSGSITNSTNAGGSGGKNSQNGQNVPGRVGGFGTGGTGGDGGTGNTQAGGAASGYGAGGGGAGGGNTAQGGGAGTAGVIYVLRGI